VAWPAVAALRLALSQVQAAMAPPAATAAASPAQAGVARLGANGLCSSNGPSWVVATFLGEPAVAAARFGLGGRGQAWLQRI